MLLKFIVLSLFISFLGFLAATWIIFEDHHVSGWKSLIPGYNLYLLSKMTNQNEMSSYMMFIPVLNFLPFYKVNKELRKKYQAPEGLELGMTFFFWAFYPLLAIKVIDGSSQNSIQFGPLPLYGPKNPSLSHSKKDHDQEAA